MIHLSLVILAAVLGSIHVYRVRTRSTKRERVTIFLVYFLFLGVGITGLFSFYGHTIMADRIAESIGWPTGSPFQTEVAITNLSFALLGLLSISMRKLKGFLIATAFGKSFFLIGTSILHIYEIITKANYAHNNAGPILYYSLVLAPILLTLSFMLLRLPDETQTY